MTETAILHYRAASGFVPFQAWIDSLDKQAAYAVAARVNRISTGHFGDWKRVGDGVVELRIDFGPGYRVYFGRDGATVVILLCGGIKRSQTADIKQAKRNWKDYGERK